MTNTQLDVTLTAVVLTPEQVSSRTGFAVQTLANWRVLGQGPRYFRVSRMVRYYSSDVADWLAAQSAS